jgi:hypothetical protein
MSLVGDDFESDRWTCGSSLDVRFVKACMRRFLDDEEVKCAGSMAFMSFHGVREACRNGEKCGVCFYDMMLHDALREFWRFPLALESS